MGAAKKSTWIGGTVFVGLVVVVAAYFLAISPNLATASQTRTEVQSTQQSNDLLQLKLVKLKADFAKLPDYKSQLDALRGQIPTTAHMADYLRDVSTIAAAHSVTITALTPSVAQSVVPAAAAAVPAPAATTTSNSPDAVTTPTVAGPAVASAGFGGLIAIPITFTIIGTYDNAVAFLSDVQNATPRLLLVSGLTGTAQKDAPASAGRPATVVGDIELAVTGFTYVLPDVTAVPAPAATPPALPGAVAGKNPLVPAAGK